MLATTARARVGARGGARVRYAGPVADGNNGMRPARRAVTERYARMPDAVGCDNEIVVRTVKGVMMLRIPTLHSIVQLYPTLHSTVAVFTASFSRGKKKRALGHVERTPTPRRMRIAQHSTCINLVLLVMFSSTRPSRSVAVRTFCNSKFGISETAIPQHDAPPTTQ